MKRLQKILISLIGLILLTITIVLMTIHVKTYQATSQAQALALEAKPIDHTLSFKAKGKAKASILFYQGALVEEEAYAPLASDLSKEGIDVYLIKSPLNLAILSGKPSSKLKEQLAKAPVYLAGHSLGGVIAAQTVNADHLNAQGLILLASYPAKKTDLSQADLRVLSIRASQDKVLNQPAYQTAKKRLPKTTEYRLISGGNHAGFGSYGKQDKDGKATISNAKQRHDVVSLITHFITTKTPDTH